MKLELSRKTFEKYSNKKFHKNASSGSRILHADRQTDMKLTVAFYNFANAPEKLSRTCDEGAGGEQRYTSTQSQTRS